MAKVFAVNLTDKDYSTAEKFGDLIFMTEGVLDLRKYMDYQHTIRNYLARATEQDYLLLNGPTLISSLALKCWFETKQKCNILIWNRNEYRDFVV